MPRANKQRGRRSEKHHDPQDLDVQPAKRRKLEQEFEVQGDIGDDFIGFAEDSGKQDGADTQNFYGLLTEEEQEYYANINSKINANDFESSEDRDAFIEAVHRETTGKEIKVASSQSCSRYLEKIIQLSKPAQLQSLFNAFLEDLDYLVQHRFGSHCCESLFRKCAELVVLNSKNEPEEGFEHPFLQVAKNFEAKAGFLLTEKFASHPFRLLLLILAGEPLDTESVEAAVASRKKERIDIQVEGTNESVSQRKVPGSFKKALTALSSAAVSKLDPASLRALATQPLGSPVIQLLLRLEFTSDAFEDVPKKDKMLLKLLGDESLDAESESGKFISGLVYDPTGSHLIETLVQFLPGKLFKKLYKNLFKQRIGKLAKNEIAGFVAIRILNRIGKDELHEALLAIIEELPGLIERNRLAVIRSLIERCTIRGVEMSLLKEHFRGYYRKEDREIVLAMLQVKSKETGKAAADDVVAIMPAEIEADLQGSLLAQTMLKTRDLSDLINESIIQLTDQELLQLAKNPIASRVIQAALTSPASNQKYLRQLVPKFYLSIGGLAISSAGSHVADALWHATSNSHFMKERLAQGLQQDETKIRESVYGRNVWKNWSMDLYQRRRGEWQALAKGYDQTPMLEKDGAPRKTAIELARERHMQKQSKVRPQLQNTQQSSTIQASV